MGTVNKTVLHTLDLFSYSRDYWQLLSLLCVLCEQKTLKTSTATRKIPN